VPDREILDANPGRDLIVYDAVRNARDHGHQHDRDPLHAAPRRRTLGGLNSSLSTCGRIPDRPQKIAAKAAFAIISTPANNDVTLSDGAMLDYTRSRPLVFACVLAFLAT
jgi:hypothetical protein